MKLMCAIVGLGLALVITGCGVVSLGPGGAAPGLISETTYPNALNPGMRYQITFTKQDIDIKQKVEATSRSSNVLGIVSWGDSGYGKLMDAARQAGADGVMNVTVDTNFRTVFFVFTEVETRLTGLAYSYKK